MGGTKKPCDGGTASANISVYYNMIIPALITKFSVYETNDGKPLVTSCSLDDYDDANVSYRMIIPVLSLNSLVMKVAHDYIL
jgi:hypothetical protein